MLFNQANLIVWLDGDYRRTGINLADDTWHHVIVQWQSVDGQLNVYVDDSLKYSTAGFKTGASIPQGGSLILGQEQDDVFGGFDKNQAFTGLLYNVKISGSYDTPGTSPTFSTSTLNETDGTLSITFSESINVSEIIPTKIHIRESGETTGGITLSSDELSTNTDDNIISFTLNSKNKGMVIVLDSPKLIIEKSAVSDLSGDIFDSTFDVDTASFAGSKYVGEQGIFPQGLAFSSDGAKMFVINAGNIHQYTLDIPFDVATASFDYFKSLSLEDSSPFDVTFSPNGAKMFVTGNYASVLLEYTLASPFDISDMSYIFPSLRMTSQDISIKGLAFSANGAKMFVVGNQDDDVNQYTLDIPFDVATASFDYSKSIVGDDTDPKGLAFSSNGVKMFVVGDDGSNVNQYTLDIPFDVATASFDYSKSVVGSPSGMIFSANGAKMFVVDVTGSNVNQYTLDTFDMTITTG